MKTLFLLGALLLSSVSACEVNILVAGQSNAVGWTPGWSLGHSKVQAWNPITKQYEQAVEPMQFFSGISGMTAPWIRLGWILRDEGKYQRVKYIGSGAGGVSITHWDEGQPGWEQLKQNLEESLVGPKIRAFVWYQGESDYSAYPGFYRAKLQNLIARVRQITRESLPVIIVKPTNYVTTQFYTALYNEIYAVADNDLYVTVVDNHGLDTLSPDTSHITYGAQNLLAKRIATVMLLMGDR